MSKSTLTIEQSIAISNELLAGITLDDLVTSCNGQEKLDQEIGEALQILFMNAPHGVTGTQFGKMVMATGLACWSADVAVQRGFKGQ